MAGIASLGGSAHYIGRVRDDQLGTVFAHDIRSLGVGYTITPAADGPATGCCLILVSPDARADDEHVPRGVGPARTRRRRRGRRRLGRHHLPRGVPVRPPGGAAAFRTAATYAHAAGRQVSLTLSDLFCVERHRDAFRDLVAGHIDILFANEAEILGAVRGRRLRRRRRGRAGRLPAGRAHPERGRRRDRHGRRASSRCRRSRSTSWSTPPGAGDQYAAGFLYGLQPRGVARALRSARVPSPRPRSSRTSARARRSPSADLAAKHLPLLDPRLLEAGECREATAAAREGSRRRRSSSGLSQPIVTLGAWSSSASSPSSARSGWWCGSPAASRASRPNWPPSARAPGPTTRCSMRPSSWPSASSPSTRRGSNATSVSSNASGSRTARRCDRWWWTSAR